MATKPEIVRIIEECGNRNEYAAYLALEVSIDGAIHRVGASVGLRESQWGSAKASRAGVVRATCSAWYEDESDFAVLDRVDAYAVLNAIKARSYELYCEAMTARENERERVLRAIRSRAVNDATRSLKSLDLTYEEADNLGDEALDWIRHRLGLTVTETDAVVEIRDKR